MDAAKVLVVAAVEVSFASDQDGGLLAPSVVRPLAALATIAGVGFLLSRKP
mgnify:CR=1 FL=1